MAQSDYFKANGYKHTYDLGDRIFGRWNGIPFIGSVGNDRYVNDLDGPEITVHLDLPIKHNDVIRNIIIVKHKDVKRLKTFN
jgi:hypothetical protein